ncbi:MAG: secretin N-terminal domain-containing protein [Chthoniobacteraceae bacterium]
MVQLRYSLFAIAILAVGSLVAQDAAPSTPAAIPAPIEPPVQVPPPLANAAPPVGDTSVTVTQQAVPGVPAGAPAPMALPATAARAHDFQGDPIDLVLRTLARQAKMSIVVTDAVSTTAGTVSMRIEDKTPKEAIEIIVESKGLILDQGKGGVYYVKTQAEKQKEPTESGNFTLNYAQAKDVVPLLQTQLQSGVAPQFDQRTNTLYYRENRSNLDKIQAFLTSIDRPTQQVMIEARLVEVTANPKQSYGINWAGVVGGAASPQTFRYGGSTLGTSTVGTAQNVTVNPVTGATTTTPRLDANGAPVQIPQIGLLPSVITDATSGTLKGQDFLLDGKTTGNFLTALAGQFAILSVPQMSATLRLLNEDSDANFLANPRVVTANNQEAKIKITRNQPVPQLNFNEQTAQAVFSGFQDKEFGNTLTVLPSINKDDFVSLNVKPEISNKVGDATFTFGGATVTSPVIDKRELNSNVLIKSGDTLAIGGLLQDEQTKGRTKVPVLGDIPILGYAFQEKIAARVKRNLLVFVTPTVIKQGYGTGLEDQVSGLTHSGEEFADPNGWRNNAKGAKRLVPTSNRQLAADYPKPGIAPAPKKVAR